MGNLVDGVIGVVAAALPDVGVDPGNFDKDPLFQYQFLQGEGLPFMLQELVVGGDHLEPDVDSI